MKFVNTKYSKGTSAHYSAGVISGNILYVSGQIPKNMETGVMAKGARAQTLQSLKNVESVLKEAGLTKENVIMCHVYISDLSMWDEVNAAYAEFFKEHRPARVVINGGCPVEIDAIAEINPD